MNWGYSIFISFVLFIALIATLVTISMNQDINLVAEDYYKQEIEYQDQIHRLQRTRDLEKQPEIRLERQSGTLVITLHQEGVESGEAHFFRPSDAAKDRQVVLSGESEQHVSVAGWDRGRWKIKLSWKANGEEYYAEETIML